MKSPSKEEVAQVCEQVWGPSFTDFDERLAKDVIDAFIAVREMEDAD